MNKKIYLAGGCFWGVEAYFSKIDGIIDTKVGYANGNTIDATYKNLKNTNHAETVKISYDSNIVSLEEILLHFFKIIDPTSLNKQGGDIGIQYRTGVYFENHEDSVKLNTFFEIIKNNYDEFYVELLPLDHFVLAEEYHQNYLFKNPNGYCHINLSADRSFNEKDLLILNEFRNKIN